MAPKRAVKRKLADATADDPILTDIDTDSETKELQVRLPHGLPLDTQPPSINSAINHPVEQECHRQLREEYIAMSIFPWMSRQLDSDYLRASALSRQGLTTRVFTVGTFYHAGTIGIRANTKKFPWSTALLAYMVRACTHTPFTAVSTLCNVHMRTHRGKYNMEGTLNILIPVTQFRQGQIWIEEEQGPDLSPGGPDYAPESPHWATDLRNSTQNHHAGVPSRDYNAAIVAQAGSITQLHGRACDIAHGILEIVYDTALLTNLALTNKAMCRKCKNALDMEGMGTKFWVNIPQRHQQIGRPIDRNDEYTPTDVKYFLFNRRMHEWRQHHLPRHQFFKLHARHVLQGTILPGRSEGARKELHPEHYRKILTYRIKEITGKVPELQAFFLEQNRRRLCDLSPVTSTATLQPVLFVRTAPDSQFRQHR
eukprot:s558_g9.t2